MNAQQNAFQRPLQGMSQQNIYEPPTDDQMKSFKISQIIKKQTKSVESLDDKELAEYCHNEWRQWMTSLLDLKQCIQKQENDEVTNNNGISKSNKTDIAAIKHPQQQEEWKQPNGGMHGQNLGMPGHQQYSRLQNNPDTPINFNHQSQSHPQTMQPQQMFYPPFYPSSFKNPLHPQNIQNMQNLQNMQTMQTMQNIQNLFMRNNQPQTQPRPSFMNENMTRPTFPFPFNPQQMQMNQSLQQQPFGQVQMGAPRGPMIGQQPQQMHQNDLNK